MAMMVDSVAMMAGIRQRDFVLGPWQCSRQYIGIQWQCEKGDIDSSVLGNGMKTEASQLCPTVRPYDMMILIIHKMNCIVQIQNYKKILEIYKNLVR